MNDAYSESKRTAALLLSAVLIVFAVLHAYWAVGGDWGLETVLGPGVARPPAGAIWAMVAVLLLFAYVARIVWRSPANAAPTAARITLAVLSLAAAAVGALNIVLGTRAAERFGIGPFAMAVALLAGYAASRRRTRGAAGAAR